MTAPDHSRAPRAADRVIIFDTTMRDGEQSPGASMSLEEKLELSKILEEMGVDVIEAGFPIASNGDFEAVRKVADDLGDLAHRLEIAVGGDRKAGLDDIDPHLLKNLGEFELLLQGHRGAGRLLAVAHGGVEDDHAVGGARSAGMVGGSHGREPRSRVAGLW